MQTKELVQLLMQIDKPKKKGEFSKFIITLVIIMNIIFTAAVLYVFLQVGNEPITLIGAWFGFTTGELWMLSSIKKIKVNKENNQSGQSYNETQNF